MLNVCILGILSLKNRTLSVKVCQYYLWVRSVKVADKQNTGQVDKVILRMREYLS